MDIQEPVHIDLKKIVASKNPTLARWMPNFIYRWLNRIAHIDEINILFKDSVGIHDVAFSNHVLSKHFQIKTSSTGLENIPSTGGVIIASNHPLGGMDGVSMVSEVGKVRQDIQFIINDILKAIPNYDNIFVGVNKHGTNPRQALQLIDNVYASGKAVLIFPAGLCSRKIDGKIQDLEWQKSFVTKAQKYQLPIIPSFVNGKNSNWFYNLANWRKKLGIKANIEMLYLSDEMFKQRGNHLRFIFSEAVPASVFDRSRKPDEWAALLRDFIYTLEQNPHARFVDFIKNK